MHRFSSRLPLLSLAGAVLLAALAPAARAHACGGFFCNATQPVVQSGEQIVYAIEDDGSLVMTVRIDYQGTAPEFAWILPVPVVPTIELGSNAMFDALGLATAPRFDVLSRTDGTCAIAPDCSYPDSGYFFADAAAASDAGAGGPRIYLDETLGPYETVVIGGSGAEVTTWLTTNGYAIAPGSTPILDAYLASGHVVVALRLRTSASTSEIQPVRLRMPGTPPCLPIRLTAIATTPDLPITAFFLASHRVVSSNYSMLDASWDDVGLWTRTVSYSSWVTREVDTLGGRAFATDYAGTTPTVMLTLPSVTDLATETDPGAFLRALRVRGYGGDAQLLALLTRFVVPPDGMMPRDFYNCLFNSFGGCDVPASYDPAGLAAAIDETITQPRASDAAMIGRHAYTTRLYTTMSAEEMTLDPEFRVDDALPAVPNVHVATFVTECDSHHWSYEAAVHAELPGGAIASVQAATPHGTDASYCARLGGYLTGTTPGVDSGLTSAPDAAVTATPGGGGGCAVGSARSPFAAIIASLALALFLARRRSPRA